MSLSRRSLLRLGLGLWPLVTTACQKRSTEPAMPTLSPSLQKSILAQRRAWRASQDAKMRGPLSPLARIDYQHIPIGDHTLSTSHHDPIHLPPELLVGFSGQLRVISQPGSVRFVSTQPVLHNDQPQTEAILRKGDTLLVGQTRLLLSGSISDPGLAVYSDTAPAKAAYSGLHYYPDSDDFVVAAKLVRTAPHPVKLLASRGEPQELTSIGDLHFSLSRDCILEAYLEAPDGDILFLIFRDQTSATPGGSYGAGRFLLAKLNADDTAVLDFHQAWNPLCAYSPYFHCPMPSRKNHLSVAITAGEKAYGDH